MQASPPDSYDGTDSEIHAWGASMIGLRGSNQDAHLVAPECGLVVVADGVGGAPAGDLASRAVVDSVRCAFREPIGLLDRSRLGMVMARRRLREIGVGPREGMASTVAMVAIDGWRAVITHAGDSRVYRLRDGVLEQLTRDHSLKVELERKGLRTRGLSARERNALTRCLTSSAAPQRPPEHAEIRVRAGDRFMVCTDGLTKVCPDEVIAHLLSHGDERQACIELLAESRERLARDDTTVAVADVHATRSWW